MCQALGKWLWYFLGFIGNFCGRQFLTWFPIIPISQYLCPCVLPSLQLWAGPRDLLPKNKIYQMSWDVISLIRLQKTILYPPSTLSWLVFSLAHHSE